MKKTHIRNVPLINRHIICHVKIMNLSQHTCPGKIIVLISLLRRLRSEVVVSNWAAILASVSEPSTCNTAMLATIVNNVVNIDVFFGSFVLSTIENVHLKCIFHGCHFSQAESMATKVIW